MHLDSKAFLNMSNLKYLIIGHSLFSRGQLYLPHGLQWLPNTLKVIKWERYPLVFLPRQTQFGELVALIVRQSKLKELWRGTQFFQSLKIIDLIHSTDLIRTPNFDQTPNLQRLILEGCTKLVEVHHSLGQHKNLVLVDFTGCKSIKNLPTKFEMDSLVTFILSGCSKIRKLPEFGKGMERLYRLDLEGTAISKLPQSMANLNGLAILNLKNCKSLACLPSDFQKLEAKDNMNISGCSNLSRSPENLNESEAMEELNVSGTATTEGIGYPQSSSSWNHYYSLLKRAFRLQRSSTSTMFLHSPFSNLLHSLAVLILCCCNLHDGSQLSEIGNLSSLAALNLSGNNFVEFPSSLISKLPKLELIGLDDCPRLQPLSQLRANLSIIKAGDCPLLKHYVREQQLWEFVEQFESQTQYARDIFVYGGIKKLTSDYNSLINTLDDSLDLEFFMQPTRILTIPGSEVPSWFHNQSYICAEDIPHRYTTNVSFMVNRPDSCRPSEWWGIAVCLVLENDLQLVKSYFSDDLCWTCGVGKGRYSTSYRSRAIHLQSSCRHQLCIIYIRFASFVAEQIQMVFFTYECVQKSSNLSIDKCGWRVLCIEDVEKWRNRRDDGCSGSNNDEFIVEEDESTSIVEPSSL